MSTATLEHLQQYEEVDGDVGLLRFIAPGLERAHSVRVVTRGVLNSVLGLSEMRHKSFWRQPERTKNGVETTVD